jgi:hypothetical protein
MTKSTPTNHKLHIFASLISFGLWLPVYFLIAVRNRGGKGATTTKVKEKSKLQKWADEASVLSATNPGYKKGNSSSSQMYVLSCTHQVRAYKATKILSKGLIGETVWCEVCNASREVTGAPHWVQ